MNFSPAPIRSLICLGVCLIFLGLVETQAALSHYFFDLGTASSPVEPGWTQVTHQTVYSSERGYGWEQAAQESFNDSEPVAPAFRATHPNFVGPLTDGILRDGVEDTRPITFLVDVPPGIYRVVVTLGRYRAFRHDMNLHLNGSVVATNIDAWGYVWGSQGGTPTKTVAAIAGPVNGQLRLTFTCAPAHEERWREYSSKRPEGGKLWYLGDNKNSIVALRVFPHIPPQLELKQHSIVGTVHAGALRKVVSDFNAGNVSAAVSAATNFMPTDVYALSEKGSILDCLAGAMSVDDRDQELALIKETIRAWSQFLEALPLPEREQSKRFWLAKTRLESAQRYAQALAYLSMLGFKWADQMTGLNKYHRYWAAYDLCGPFTSDDPLYFKSHLLRGRVAMWNGHEGHWKNCYDLAKQHFQVLRAAYPEDRIVRMYSGEQIPARQRWNAIPGNAPEWARLQHEALHRYLELIHYWVERRQSANGELGGGWGDDVEILRAWLPAVLALNDPVAQAGLRNLANGVSNSGEITNGYSREIDDVEHAAELMADTQPLMCLVDYGNPDYLERCMATMRGMRDVWTAVNARGHRHFKSHYFSATSLNTNVPRTADVALNGRAANPGIPLLWYVRHPTVQMLLGEWCRAWIEDAFRVENGKPPGFVPGSIRFEDDRLGGHAEQWWQTRDYFSDFESVGYTQTLYEQMLAMFAVTGNDFYFSSLRATVDAVMAQTNPPLGSVQVGSSAWAARVSDCREVADVVAKWRQLTGQKTYDAFLKRRGSPYTQFVVSGDETPLKDELREIIRGLSANIEMSTSEVLFTDRVNLPGNTVLFEMMTGSVGTPTYYPMHAVTWQNTGNQLAVLVETADTTNLAVQLFNFATTPLKANFRLWRLDPGMYVMSLNPVAVSENDSSSKSHQLKLEERGQEFALTLPEHQLLRLRLSQEKRLPTRSHRLPDLALGSDALEVLNPPVKVGKPARLRLTVHNLGVVAAPPATAELRAGKRKIASARWPAVEAPLDLQPRKTAVEVVWTPHEAGRPTLRLHADPRNNIQELVELNNERVFDVEVSK